MNYDKNNYNLYNQIIDPKNIFEAYKKARKSRRYKKVVLNFSFSLEKNWHYIYYCLTNKNYIHGHYSEFLIKDSKKRIIESVPFKDRVIHHSLCNIIEPLFDKSFIVESYACRKNKGSHQANKQLRKYLKSVKDKNNLKDYSCIYYLKCDITKYFNSIDHNILKTIIQKRIKDAKTMWLINLIIDSYHKDTNKGIPIGNLTSQLFANIYLNELDYFIKYHLHCKYFIRYMDDFIILDIDKRKL
jgi:retron-type reverse transcriptase